ncbi:hypothetical protein [Peribacillus muralis]|uniref:hypothetical protein n=1 Tax=Peribacillus muralis TaxID=264697 RepID=UPI00070D210B|nr:hypothetical protein [Peribacillus muralis]
MNGWQIKGGELDEAEVVVVFAFMRSDAVLCRAALVVGKRGFGGLVCWMLVVVRIAGGCRKFDGHSVFA